MKGLTAAGDVTTNEQSTIANRGCVDYLRGCVIKAKPGTTECRNETQGSGFRCHRPRPLWAFRLTVVLLVDDINRRVARLELAHS